MRLLWLRGANAESCPGKLEVERRVRVRLRRDPFATEANRTIEASLDHTNGTWHAELIVRNAAGQIEGRRVFDVQAKTCTEVVDAIGLAVALAIDPHADLTSPVTEPPADGSAPVTRQGEAPSRSAIANDIDDPQRALKPIAAGEDAAQCRHSVIVWPRPVHRSDLGQSKPQHPYVYDLTLAAEVGAGILPGLAPGMAVEGAFGRSRLQLTLGLDYFPEKAQNAQFSFGLTAARVGVCGALLNNARLSASICGDLGVGAMHAVVRHVEALHPGDRMFVALGLGPRLGWQPWAPLFINAGVSARFALARPEFAARGVDAEIFEPRAIGGVGFIGIGIATR